MSNTLAPLQTALLEHRAHIAIKGTPNEDLTWCYWCENKRTDCVCAHDPNGIPPDHWSLQPAPTPKRHELRALFTDHASMVAIMDLLEDAPGVILYLSNANSKFENWPEQYESEMEQAQRQR